MTLFLLIVFYGLTAYLIIFKTKHSLYLLLAALPFQPFLKTFFNNFFINSNLENLLLSAWKEFFIVSLFLVIVLSVKRVKIASFKLIKSDYIIIFLFLLAFLSFIFTGLNLAELAYGIKYSLLFLLLYFSIRTVEFRKKEIRSLIKLFLITVGLVALFSLIQLALPGETLSYLGYQSQVDWQAKQNLSFFQQAAGMERVFGPLSGPNQLGLYLSFSFLIIIGLIKKRIYIFNKYFLYLLSFTILLLIGLTFSRTAWMATIAGVISLAFIGSNHYKKFYLFLPLIILIIASMFLLLAQPEIIIRHTDQTRIERLTQSANMLIDNPLGLGIGKTGPASQWTELNKGLISENQYLQIGLELGLLGLLAYLSLFISFIKKAYHGAKKSRIKIVKGLNVGLFASIVGLLVSGLFLHSLTDATLIYSFAIILGLGLNNSQQAYG